MESHKQLKEKLKNNNLISPIDQITACGKHGFTDLHFTKLDKRLTQDSKYYIAINIDNKPIILNHPNFFNLRQEIDEKMIKKEFFTGYDRKNNRVIFHYKGDGIFRIGNKNGINEFTTKFNICNLHMLAKRNNYKLFIESLPSKDRHPAIQILLCELGISLGFKVKVAKNDLKPIINSDYSLEIRENLLSIPNIDLSNIKEERVKKNIDLIDVLWCDSFTSNIIAAFEVERSKNYDAVLRRLAAIESSSTYLVCVGDDFYNFKNTTMNPIFFNWFKSKNLNYLNMESLFSMLDENKKYGNSISLHLLLAKNIIKVPHN